MIVPDNWDFERQDPSKDSESSGLSILYDQMMQNLEIDECFLRTNLVKQEKDRQSVVVKKAKRRVTKRKRTSRRKQTEELETKEQVTQRLEEEAKKKEAIKAKPKAKRKRPTSKQIREKRLTKNKKIEDTPATQRSTQRTERSTQRTERSTQRTTGRRRGY